MKTIANSQFFRTVFEQWKNSFAQSHVNGPILHAIIKNSLPKQFYRSSLENGVCKLQGGSESSVLQGIGMLDVAFKSRHIGDYLGDKQAQFSCRWIYPQGNFSEEVLCERLMQMGYNGVILKSIPENPVMFKELGIQILLNPRPPSVSPFDSDWKPCFDDLEAVQGIYWKGTYTDPSYLHHLKARDDLQIDLALREVRALEKVIDGRCMLIYELDSSGAVHWVPEFMDEVGKETLISFSSFNGKPTENHQDYHPLWRLLRELPDTSATRLLPVLNMGGVNQGEGFWPVIPLELLEYAIDHMRRQPFAGAIVLTQHLSQPGTFLDGALWTAGQALWGGHSPALLLETWCKAFHFNLSSLELLTDISKVNRRLSALKDVEKRTTEECRILSESLMGELNRLQRAVDQCSDSEGSSIKDYFVYFARDARRQILHFLQAHHAPMVNVLNGDDLQESFWTGIEQSGRSGLSSGGKVKIFDQPQSGEKDSSMRRIYNEVVSLN